MKRFIFCLIIIGAILFFPLDARAENGEYIPSYKVDIWLSADATFKVREIIKYDFAENEKHGIFRDLPFVYKARGGKYKVRITDIKVTDEQGNEYKKTISTISNDSIFGDTYRIKIGDPDTLVTGQKTYIIEYNVRRAVNFFKDFSEVYWNAIGTEWALWIKDASATVYLPKPLEETDVRTKCYSGILGGVEECFDIVYNYNDNKKVISVDFKSRELLVYEGLTVVIGLYNNNITEPNLWQKIKDILADNWVLFTPMAIFVLMFVLWYRHGRDPKGRGTIIAEFEAPDKLTPAEVGTIIEEGSCNAHISAEIIYLATQGYLKIEHIADDYKFSLLREIDENLPDWQKIFLSNFFDNGKKKETLLSEQKNKFYSSIIKITDSLNEVETKKGYFPSNPESVKWAYIAFSFFGAIVGCVISGMYFGLLAIVAVIVSSLIIAGFGWFMSKRTRKGVLAKEAILGLKLYMTVAEAERIKFHNAPAKNPAQFEKLLPYAMVLGVEKEWANQFKDIYRQPPNWYVDGNNAMFNAIIFSNMMRGFSTNTQSIIVSRPSSSSHGAGGGFSGFGGGFSGGGFGGGGGGSW